MNPKAKFIFFPHTQMASLYTKFFDGYVASIGEKIAIFPHKSPSQCHQHYPQKSGQGAQEGSGVKNVARALGHCLHHKHFAKYSIFLSPIWKCSPIVWQPPFFLPGDTVFSSISINCIIFSTILQQIKLQYKKNTGLSNLLSTQNNSGWTIQLIFLAGCAYSMWKRYSSNFRRFLKFLLARKKMASSKIHPLIWKLSKKAIALEK